MKICLTKFMVYIQNVVERSMLSVLTMERGSQ